MTIVQCVHGESDRVLGQYSALEAMNESGQIPQCWQSIEQLISATGANGIKVLQLDVFQFPYESLHDQRYAV